MGCDCDGVKMALLSALFIPKCQKDDESKFVGTSGTDSTYLKKKKEEVKITNEMATLRPKSPRPVPIKGEKDESIWDKIGTLGRKKRIKEGKYYCGDHNFSIEIYYIWSST